MELKIHDSQFAGGIDSTGRFEVMNDMFQGITDVSRIGLNIKNVKTLLRFSFENDPAQFGSIVRYILVVDKQTNGVLATQAQLMADSTTGNRAVLTPFARVNYKRFRVLLDKRVHLSSVGVNVTTRSHVIRWAGNTRFLGAGAGIANVSTNAILLYVVTNVVAGAAVPIVTWYCRHRYVG